ncbi:MAG TPA: cupin domain-containing protein [Chthonomonadaceae bacterium]|nr:cupin domain-containing protein [Chthonomonadaceae bacterium]
MAEQHGKIVPPENAQPADVFGVQVNILLRSEDTGGTFCAYEVIVPPGGGPPPHVHSHNDEAFYVLEGEIEIRCGEKTVQAGAGTYVYLPRHIPHAFKNVGEANGRLLGTATPGGHERFFEDVDRLSRNGPPPMDEALAVCRKHGIELLLPAAAPA